MDVLRVVVVIHDSHFDGYALLLCLEIDDVVEEVGAVTVYVTHKLFQSVLGVEYLLACLAFLVGAHVTERDTDAGVKESQLTHASCHDVPLVVSGGEDGGVRPELLACTALCGLAYNLYGIERLALLVFLLIDLAVAEHLRLHVSGERIYAAHAHTVQTTADFVRALVELASGVEDGHYHFKCRLVQLLMLVYGDASSVILNGYRLVLVDGHFDVRAIARHRLVDGVVNGLVDEVVETLFADVSDIHRRALAHCLKSFEDLDVACRIVVTGVLCFCHF